MRELRTTYFIHVSLKFIMWSTDSGKDLSKMVLASPPASLLNRGQRLIVVSKLDPRQRPAEPSSASAITIPCPTSIPNVTVHLYDVRN